MNQMPGRIARLPRDEKGRPVPWFVMWIEGKPDFRVIGPGKILDAYLNRKCWVCGERLGKYVAFILGPMCAINRTSAEPPSHKECALFSVQSCPFLSTPQMHRRGRDLPEGAESAGGIMILRNPGVSLVWITESCKAFGDSRGGILFEMGPSTERLWFKEGRQATAEEIVHSINTGLPELAKLAEEDGLEAIKALGVSYRELISSLGSDEGNEPNG